MIRDRFNITLRAAPVSILYISLPNPASDAFPKTKPCLQNSSAGSDLTLAAPDKLIEEVSIWAVEPTYELQVFLFKTRPASHGLLTTSSCYSLIVYAGERKKQRIGLLQKRNESRFRFRHRQCFVLTVKSRPVPWAVVQLILLRESSNNTRQGHARSGHYIHWVSFVSVTHRGAGSGAGSARGPGGWPPLSTPRRRQPPPSSPPSRM